MFECDVVITSNFAYPFQCICEARLPEGIESRLFAVISKPYLVASNEWDRTMHSFHNSSSARLQPPGAPEWGVEVCLRLRKPRVLRVAEIVITRSFRGYSCTQEELVTQRLSGTIPFSLFLFSSFVLAVHTSLNKISYVLLTQISVLISTTATDIHSHSPFHSPVSGTQGPGDQGKRVSHIS